MSQLFLSHSSRNNAEAVALSEWLKAEGWDDQFLDLDPERGIVAGERWEQALHQAASRCDAVLFLVSRHWLDSDWCRRELNLAIRLNKRIFAVLVEDLRVDQLPAELKDQWQLVNLAAGNDHGAAREVTLPGQMQPSYVYYSQHGLQQLRAGLHKAGLKPDSFVWPPATDPNRPPYRGLQPLMAEDAGIYFGREGPIIELLAQLRGLSETAPPRFLAILGASGAGKSSFLRAGILPRLERDDRHYLPLPVIRPEQAVIDGNHGLLSCLDKACQKAGMGLSRRQLSELLDAGSQAVAQILDRLAEEAAVPDWDGKDRKAPTLVLAIDQGEELFQADGQQQARRFLQLLGELLSQERPKLIALLTIRTDSYDPLQSAIELQHIQQRSFSLPPLPRGAYRQVIEEPARLLARSERPLKIDPRLTDALLQDIDIDSGGAKDALPLLAFTLQRLYIECGGDGDLTLEEYRDLGRIEGAIETAVDQALKANPHDPKLPGDTDERLKLLRRGLIPWLAGIDPQTNQPRRKVARLEQIPQEARALIQHFIEHRLLATDKNEQGETTVEPAHEALLRQWSKLRGWLDEDAAALSTLESVKSASRDWEANARDAKWLVHQTGRLEDAEALLQREDLAANLDQGDRSYLYECRRQEDQRRDRELQQARELSEAQRREAEAEKRNADAQKRVAQRTRIGLLAALVLAAVSVVLAFSSWRLSEASRLSEAEARYGQARQLLQEDATFAAGLEALALGFRTGRITELPKANELFADLLAPNHPSPPSDQIAFQSRLASMGAPVTPPIQHESAVRIAKFSPDSRWVVTASSNTAQIWSARTGLAQMPPMRHDSDVMDAEFSPDGRWIVTALTDASAQVWDVRSGTRLSAPMTHQDTLDSADIVSGSRERWQPPPSIAHFSPDGGRVVTASRHTVRIWDVRSSTPLTPPMEHYGYLQDAQFSSDGRLILTTLLSGSAGQIWDAGSGEQLDWEPPSGTKYGQARESEGMSWDHAQLSPDGRLIVTTSAKGTVQVWDAHSGAELALLIERDESGYYSAQFSPDGRRVVTVSGSIDSDSGEAQIWDARSGAALTPPMRLDSDVTSAQFTPDGRWVVTISGNYTVRLWDARSGVARTPPMRHKDKVTSAMLSPDGRLVVTASEDKMARVWDAGSRGPLTPQMQHRAEINDFQWSPDGRWIVTASSDNTARVWDARSGSQLASPMQHENAVHSVQFSPNGRWVVTASEDDTVRVWDARNGAALTAPMKHDGAVTSAQFSPDGRWIVTSSEDGTARIWDADDGAALTPSMHHFGAVKGAQFSRNGRWVVTASTDKTARVWDARSGEAVAPPIQHYGAVHSAQFSPDGRWVVTASDDKTARVWDALNGAAYTPPMKHDGGVTSAQFSPDGRWVVTASDDETARVWDAHSGVALTPPIQHESAVTSAQFRSDGRQIVTASGRRVQVWDARSGDPWTPPMEQKGWFCGAKFSPNGRWVLSACDDGAARVWDVLEFSGSDPALDRLLGMYYHCEDSSSLKPANRCQRRSADQAALRLVIDAISSMPLRQSLQYHLLGELRSHPHLAGSPYADDLGLLRRDLGLAVGVLNYWWQSTGDPRLGAGWVLAIAQSGDADEWPSARRTQLRLRSESLDAYAQQDLALADIRYAALGSLRIGLLDRPLWQSASVIPSATLPYPKGPSSLGRHPAPSATSILQPPWGKAHRTFLQPTGELELDAVIDALFVKVPSAAEAQHYREVLEPPAETEAVAAYALARLLDSGSGESERDPQEVMRLMERAADQGLAPAANFLGYTYLFGTSNGNQDLAKARAWLAKATAADHPYAWNNLGVLLNDQYDDPAAAASAWRRAVELGDDTGNAARSLARLLELGRGVSRDLPAAMALLRTAAAGEYDEAQFQLALRLEHGLIAAPDPVEAMAWYARAATQGHARAAYRLGQMYETGIGDSADAANAAGWYRLAAMQGHVASHYALARLILESAELRPAGESLAQTALQRLIDAANEQGVDKFSDLYWLAAEGKWLAEQQAVQLERPLRP